MIGINEITFDNGTTQKKTYTDWGLLMMNRDIGSAPVKSQKIDVPYRDGALIYTLYGGRAFYSNRTLEFSFKMTEPDDFYKKYTTIAEFLHGKNMKISIPEDRSYYYEGICGVSDLSVSKALGKIIIGVDAAPYKYSKASSISDIPWDDVNFEETYFHYLDPLEIGDSLDITIPKGHGFPVVPVFNVTAKYTDNFTVQQRSPNGAVCYMNLGKNRFPNIKVCGETAVKLRFTGSGTLTIDYREQRL